MVRQWIIGQSNHSTPADCTWGLFFFTMAFWVVGCMHADGGNRSLGQIGIHTIGWNLCQVTVYWVNTDDMLLPKDLGQANQIVERLGSGWSDGKSRTPGILDPWFCLDCEHAPPFGSFVSSLGYFKVNLTNTRYQSCAQNVRGKHLQWWNQKLTLPNIFIFIKNSS